MEQSQYPKLPVEEEARPKSVEHTQALEDFKDHLALKWQQTSCPCCHDLFFKKVSSSIVSCGTFDCEGEYDFIESKPARKKNISALQVHEDFINFFESKQYIQEDAIALAGTSRHTLFTGTAGQVFDKVIFDEKPIISEPRFVVQPVVRMQRRQHDGFMKSFVNISLEQINATGEEHLGHLENYLDYLSQLGIYAGDLTLKIYEDIPDWGTGKFDSAVMGIYYSGLEIGVLNYFTDIPQSTRTNLSMSDVSFGLERITWALNRNPRFIDVASPGMELLRATPHDVLDAYRTITLMLQSGVRPQDNNQQSGKLRSLFSANIPALDPIRCDLIEYYDDWWRSFTKSTLPHRIIKAQWDTLSLKRLKNELPINIGEQSFVNTDALIEHIIAKGIIRARDLKRLEEYGK